MKEGSKGSNKWHAAVVHFLCSVHIFFVRCMCSIIIDVLPSRSFFSNIFRAHGFSAANRERADHFTTWTSIKYKSIFPLLPNVVYWTIVVVDFSTNIQATAEISTNTTHPPSIIWYITICANNQRPKKVSNANFFSLLLHDILRCLSASSLSQLNYRCYEKTFFLSKPRIQVFVRTNTLKFEFKFIVCTCCRKAKDKFMNAAFDNVCIVSSLSHQLNCFIRVSAPNKPKFVVCFFKQWRKNCECSMNCLKRDSSIELCACECGKRLTGTHI